MELNYKCFNCRKKGQGHRFKDRFYCRRCYELICSNMDALKPFDEDLETFIKNN